MTKKFYYVVRHGRIGASGAELVSKPFTNKTDAEKVQRIRTKENKDRNIYYAVGWQWNDADGKREFNKLPLGGGRNPRPQPISRNAISKTEYDKQMFIREIKLYQHGKPTDQLTGHEIALVKKYPQTFENDNGYIKVKRGRKPDTRYNGSATRTSTEVKSPTRTETSTDAYTSDNITVTGGAGAGATTKVTIVNKGKRKNESASDFTDFQRKQLNDISKMFQGEVNGQRVRVLQPDIAPKGNKARLGQLVQLKIKKNGEFKTLTADKDAYLVCDLRKNLWVVGKGAILNGIIKPKYGEMKYLGDLVQIDYVTAKQHIENGKLTRFWHPLGEVDKEYPSLWVDHDGFPIIIGGGYDIWKVGIVN